MSINPLLSLRTQSLDTATPVRNLIDMSQQKEQLDIQKSQNEREERMMDLREQKVSADIIQQAYERQSEKQKERQRNASIASAQLKRVLESQGPEAAMEWLRQNRDGNDQFRLPQEDMDKAINMLQEGKIDQLKTGLSNNIYVGESLGLIETPDQPAQFEPVVDDEGNIIGQRNTQTGEVKSDPRAGDEADFSATNVVLPGTNDQGERQVVRGRKTDQGSLQILNDQGEWVEAPRDAYMTGMNVSGTREEVLPSGEQKDLRNQQVAAMNFVDTTVDALNFLQENPDINTWTASGAALVNDLQQEAKAFARAAGKEFDEDVLDPSKYSDTFDNLGIQSDRMKSMFVSLAFQAATASGQTGRSVSDKDIQRFMQQVGQRSADPRAMAKTLTDIAERTVRNFKNSYKVRKGTEFEGDLGLSSLPTFEPQQQPGPNRERAGQQGGNIELDPETQSLLEKYQ